MTRLSANDDAINLHRLLKGKIEIRNRIPLDNYNDNNNDATNITRNNWKRYRREKTALQKQRKDDNKNMLALLYTPGVAHVAKEISKNKKLAYHYTSKWNNVAIVCDGTRLLGLGNLGPHAAIPVMEGKSMLFKAYANINAFPLCISTQDKEEIIKFVKNIEPVFGAINIEDIESPKVLEIVDRLRTELSIAVFHDDQHGTAVIALAALLNALKLVDKRLEDIRIIIAGAGSSGYGIFKILLKAGCQNIIVADSKGALYKDRLERKGKIGLDNKYKKEISEKTNPRKLVGDLEQLIKQSDIFIGVSGKAGLLNKNMIRSMDKHPIIFALSNPNPEISPDDALKSGARIVFTARSDYPNQVNNVLVFPYILRALLDTKSKNISEEMLLKVAYAIAGLIKEDQLKENYLVPKVNDSRLMYTITQAVKNFSHTQKY